MSSANTPTINTYEEWVALAHNLSPELLKMPGKPKPGRLLTCIARAVGCDSQQALKAVMAQTKAQAPGHHDKPAPEVTVSELSLHLNEACKAPSQASIQNTLNIFFLLSLYRDTGITLDNARVILGIHRHDLRLKVAELQNKYSVMISTEDSGNGDAGDLLYIVTDLGDFTLLQDRILEDTPEWLKKRIIKFESLK